MSLFQISVLKKYLKQQDNDAVAKAYKKFTKYFHNPTIQQNIRDSKEEQFQEGFLRELFVNVLGYTLSPNANYNLTTELKNEKGAKKADGAILKDGQALGVIELKGTNTKDLEKVRQQAFDYKANQTGCVYVVTANFEKLRFYINNAVDFEEFDLFTLKPERFQLLYLCLVKDNVLNNLPLKIKEESVQEEEKITKLFYAHYSLFKRELYRDLVKRNMKNEVFRTELNNTDTDRGTKNIKRNLFKKSQKLIDRFLFIFFAEDRGLLPPNSTLKILEQWNKLKELDEIVPLYKRFKKYFNYLDLGRKGTTHSSEIFAYNGGLFKPDAMLDSLLISDELLFNHAKKLSGYDFESQVDVNILGHIFENSLNEIESINAEIEGTDFDKQKTKRKKDGVFYTPKYITKYIVDNTVGKLCAEKKAELKIAEEEFHPKRQKETKKKLLATLENYRQWLLQLTILDPACGSGAFLNQALDFLIKEHHYTDELQTNLLGGGLVFPNIENTVLENNIFGVDINEESVEIAKLSLWLRTAQPRRKLNVLSNNIKCGNSLIDSKAVAGDKAFNWQTEFPNIFKKKNKKAWHITTATHNSRTSQRMWDLKIEPGEAVWLDTEKELLVSRAITTIVKEDQLNVLAYNICGDHMHIMLVCDEAEQNTIVAKIKGRSSYMLNRGVNPSGQKAAQKYADGTRIPTWTRRFNTSYITSDEKYDNTVAYIQNNRKKHELPENKELQKLAKEMCCSHQHAFRTEYAGGFDVVIGNPPYVRLEAIKDESEKLSKLGYSTFDKRGDLYLLFVERGMSILKHKGVISYIMPNKWLQAGYGENLREYFLEKQLISLIDFGDIQIFQGATTYPCIFIAKNDQPNSSFSVSVLKSTNAFDFETIVNNCEEIFETSDFNENTWVISSKREQQFLEKLNENCIKLSDFINGEAYYGIKTGLTEAFVIDGFTKQHILNNDSKANEIVKPILRGRDIMPWLGKSDDCYVIGTFPALNIDIDNYLSIKEHLLTFGVERLEQSGKKGSRKKTSNKWFETQDTIAYYKEFAKPKIMYQVFQVKPCFIYDEKGLFCNNSVWFIPTDNKALLGVLNSKMGWWLITKFCTQIQNGCQLIWKYFGQIPVPELNSVELTALVEKIIIQTQNEQTISNTFIKYLMSKNTIDKLNRKLENWHELDFSEFIKELNKAIKKAGGEKLSKLDEMEWMDVFETKKAEAQSLKTQITQTDREIDQMVYALYGLSEEEIAIVEGE